MFLRSRRFTLIAAIAILSLLYLWSARHSTTGHFSIGSHEHLNWPLPESSWKIPEDDEYLWKTVQVNHPVTTFRPIPDSPPKQFPQVQATFPVESEQQQAKRVHRQQTIKSTFARCWSSYKKHAWMADELEPVSGGTRNPFGGWAATLVDSLDTLWIMEMRDDFNDAVAAVDTIDFTHTDLGEVNVFETTIRYLGGFLAAFELSDDVRLLRKAVQVGEMVFKAFDTPSHMPITRWNIHAAADGAEQEAHTGVLIAEIGSLCMELTRLSQLTGDPKWFDAVQAITENLVAQQDSTELPGLWPLGVNAKDKIFNSGGTFTLGAMADSVYEYLPKMAAMMGGQLPEYQVMYEKAVDKAKEYNLFRPMTPTNEDILISGQVHTKSDNGKIAIELEPQGQHLVCFLGGMLAIGGRLFNRAGDLDLATKLTDGCVYTYKAFPHGIMPETFYMAPCDSTTDCQWDEGAWKKHVKDREEDKEKSPEDIIEQKHLPQGFTHIPDKRYILRPEAIESVFVLYRVTARQDLAESAWEMFEAIEKVTKTELANSAVGDVTVPEREPQKLNSMESFWMGETLKYFYLVFSAPSVISLDDYMFNTEAHPLRRLRP